MYMYIVLSTIYAKEYVIDGSMYIIYIYNKKGSTPPYPMTLIVINTEYIFKTIKY